MDDLISMLLRVFGRVFMLLLEIRLVGWFFYTVGYAVSKTVTLGKFPAGNDDSMRMKISYLVPFPFSFEWLIHHKPGEVCSGLCLH